MDPNVERTILHYYPQRALTSPLQNPGVSWDYDPEYKTLKAIMADLKKAGGVRPGTRGKYDVSEELIVEDAVRVQLSYLGPYAAIDYKLADETDEDRRAVARAVKKVLDKHGVLVLADDALEEGVPWIQHGAPATVWKCLFAPTV